MLNVIRFYKNLSIFSIKEEQSSLSSTVAGFILYPCFIWIFSKLWLGLNQNISTFSPSLLFAYIGLTEILFMTTLRAPLIDRGCADFSISFVRPRSWPIYTIISIYSRTIYRRLIYIILYLCIIPILTDLYYLSGISSLRFIFFLPLITLIDALYSFLFTCMQVVFYEVKTFRLLFGKLFLIFGGVLAPLSDLPSPWNLFFLNTPFADIVFQPCYFSIKGEFYQMSFETWMLRIFVQIFCLFVLSNVVYRYSRNQFHNFGG